MIKKGSFFSLSVKCGGLAIYNPCERCDIEYVNSRSVTQEMVQIVKNQEYIYDNKVEITQRKRHAAIRAKKYKVNNETLDEIRTGITERMTTRTIEASLEIGASNWLTSLPIKKYGFILDKQSFWDSLYIRYNIPLKRLPTTCVCGASFKIEHALSCPKGGFILIRHNEIRDFTAELLAECCKDVKMEPELQELTGEILPPSIIQTNDALKSIYFYISSLF